MEKDLIDDIEILDDVEIIDEVEEITNDEEIVDLLSDFDASDNKDAIYNGDFGMEVEKEPVQVEEKIEVPVIELPEEVIVEDIMSKTYNLAEVGKMAVAEVLEEKDEFDGRKSAIFIGVLFVVLVVFVLALPYITKLVVK